MPLVSANVLVMALVTWEHVYVKKVTAETTVTLTRARALIAMATGLAKSRGTIQSI